MTDVTHTINENGTSLLHVELDAYNSKCLHLFANPPEDWVENIISSRCQPLCCKLWECHVKDCCKDETMVKKCSKAELILGYEPEPEAIFEPVGRCVDNEDGTCVIEVDIDVIYTKKIQELLPNFCESVKSIICEKIELEAETILDKVAHKGEHINKKARDIIMEYQREEFPEPVFENTPFVDPLADLKIAKADLEIIRPDLTATKADLQTTKADLQATKADLETTKTQLQATKADLDLTKVDLQTTRADIQSALLETSSKTIETIKTQLEVEKIKNSELQKKLELLEMSQMALISRLEAIENM